MQNPLDNRSYTHDAVDPLRAKKNTSHLEPIENVDIGDRVTQYKGGVCRAQPTFESMDACAVIGLEVQSSDGDGLLTIELMRSLVWIDAHQAEVGHDIGITLGEHESVERAYVRSISSCPVIESGDGCVVTGTFAHDANDVVELKFENTDLILQPTSGHPFWSEDQDGWVRAGQLGIGEHLRSESGPLEIGAIRWVDGTHQVFNLEVAGNHTYLVGTEKLLTHNECFPFKSLRGKSHKFFRKHKPKDWQEIPAENRKGWRWLDKAGNERFRFMRPNKADKWGRTNGYIRWKNEAGDYLDIDGNVVDQSLKDYQRLTHIPYEGIWP